jgi:hypothetical protein
LGKAYGLNTQVLLANLQHFCNNNIIILNYYYFIPGLFPSHSWWAESCSVRLSRGRDGVQSATSELPGCPSAWTTGRIHGRLHFSSRRPLIVSSIPSSVATVRPDSGEASFYCLSGFRGGFIIRLHEPTQNKSSSWMMGRIKGCSVCCAY